MRPLAASLLTIALATTAVRAEEPAKKTDDNFDNRKPLVEGIKKADKIIVYEGMPHPTFDKDLLASELKQKKNVRLHQEYFYDSPKPVKEAVGKVLTDVIADPASLQAYRGPKRCGGFHPDYAVEWKAGSDTYHVQICYGCKELKIYGPKLELHCDIKEDALNRLKETLAKFRENRPGK
jgi:hypothetical protein